MLADSPGGLETDWSRGFLTRDGEFFCSACQHSVGLELDSYSLAVPVPLCVNFLCLSFLIIKTVRIMITNFLGSFWLSNPISHLQNLECLCLNKHCVNLVSSEHCLVAETGALAT